MANGLDVSRVADIGLFAGLDDEELEQVASRMGSRRAPVGNVLVAEGDELAATLHVILSGTATVHRAGVHVADLGPGEVFGEAGTSRLQPRNATVIVTTPAEVAWMMGWDFRELLERSPAVRANVDALVAARTGDS